MPLVKVAQTLKANADIIREKKLKAHNDKMTLFKILPSL